MLLLASSSPVMIFLGIVGFILFPWLLLSVIGYIYHRAIGSRTTFRQIMTKRWVFVLSGFLIGLGFVSQLGKVLSMVISKNG